MALKISTGFLNQILGGRSVRELLNDMALDLYSGTPPAYADDSPSVGVLLCTLTKSGGALLTTDRSTPQVDKITIPNATLANTVKINVTVDGVGPTTLTYTIVSADTTDTKVAIKVARMINDNYPLLRAIADQAATGPAVLWVQGMDGLAFTLADGGGSTTATITNPQAAVVCNGLHWTAPSGVAAVDSTQGAISNLGTETWQGTPAATGVVGWFRFRKPGDSQAQSLSDVRVQGVVAPSGSEMDMPNPNVTAGTPISLSSYSLNLANASS